MAKYHCQVVSAGRFGDGRLYHQRDLHAQHRQVVVEAKDLTEAIKTCNEDISAWDGDWLIDGYPELRGSHVGSMVG